MKTPLRLIRLEQNEHATFGLLQDAENNKVCVTLEPPWRNNEHNVSCIPAGSYQCRRAMHHGKYEVFELADVPHRDAIHIHIGNFVSDTEGCILLGTAPSTFHGERGITGSKAAFDKFMDEMEGVDSFTLDVMNPFPVAA